MHVRAAPAVGRDGPAHPVWCLSREAAIQRPAALSVDVTALP